MVDNPKEKIRKALGQLTSEQIRWLSYTFFIIGTGLIVKTAAETWPSIPITTAKSCIFAATVACLVKLSQLQLIRKDLMKWLIPISTGCVLNLVVIIANGGFMPVGCEEVVRAMYIPLDGANLAYLADWIFGVMSPGDILILGAAVGIALTLIRRQPQHKLVEQAMKEEA